MVSFVCELLLELKMDGKYLLKLKTNLREEELAHSSCPCYVVVQSVSKFKQCQMRCCYKLWMGPSLINCNLASVILSFLFSFCLKYIRCKYMYISQFVVCFQTQLNDDNINITETRSFQLVKSVNNIYIYIYLYTNYI